MPRKRRLPLLRRSLAIMLALALLLSGGIALAAPRVVQASGIRNDYAKMDYLALGDSVAFGYSPLVDPSDADNFIGYPTPVADALNLKLTNAACPGATSGYFISLSEPDWLCTPFRSAYPLHVSYSTSQLDYAVSFLRSHPRTRLVTINIGVNDLFRLQSLICGGDITCVQEKLPAALAAISANLDTIYATLRYKAHYHGQLVALTYYSTNYNDATTTGIVQALDQVIAERTRAWGGAVADGFSAFAAYGADPCAAGLLIHTSPTTCDIHPSVLGRNVLAAAIVAVVKHNADKSIAA